MVLNIRQLRRKSSITPSGLELDLPLVANSTIKYAGRDDLQVQVDLAAYDVSTVSSTVTSHATLHAQHTASLATKVATADGVHTGETAIANLVVGHTGNPEATCHIAGDLIVGSESTSFQVGHDNSNSIYLEGDKPQYVLYETGSVNSDERMWAFRSSGGELSLIARTDNDGSGNTAMSFDRSGSTITSTSFGPALTIDHTASPPAVSINGNDIQGQIDANGAALLVERGRLDVLIDSGTTLDQISELKTAWESGDGTLNSAIDGLTTTAAADRAAIRAEHTADQSSQGSTITAAYVAADSALSASLTSAYQAADQVVTNAYVAADAAQSTALTNAYQAADTALVGTLNSTISALGTDVAANEGAISTLQTTVNTTHANLHTTHSADAATLLGAINGNNADIAVNVTAIALNTAKVGFTDALVAAAPTVTANTAKVGFTDALVAAAPTVTANTAKLSYTAAASTQVASNVTDINTLLGAINSNSDDITANVVLINANTQKVGYTNALVALAPSVAANTAKLSYTDEAQVSTNKDDIATHETRHDGHDTTFATKLNTSGHQTMNGRLTVQYDGGNGVVANPHADDLQVYHYNDAGITIGAPEGKIGTLAFSDQNKADRNQIRAYSTVRDSRNIGMHFLANQTETAVPTLSVVTQLVGINNAQPTYTLDVTGTARITSTVFMTGLPSSDPGVVGQLYVKADGLLRVSSG